MPCGLRFFMYDEPSLNHRWLRHCPKFEQLRSSSKAENTAEVGLHKVLAHHPARTHDAREAALFYVPVFEYSSHIVGSCHGGQRPLPPGLGNHSLRMAAAQAALLRSEHWQRQGGRDHFWASTAFSAHGYTLERRMSPLSSALGCSTVGRYKAGPFGRPSRVGECVIEIPYQASLHVMNVMNAGAGALGPSHGQSKGRHADTTHELPSKKHLLFFAGSLDVCCTGRLIRCAVGDLHAATATIADVLIRPTGGGPCTRRALERAANLSSMAHGSGTVGPAHQDTNFNLKLRTNHASRTTKASLDPNAAGADGHEGVRHEEAAPAAAGVASAASTPGRYVGSDVVERTAREMASSTWCLCPAGDTCVTSRLYTAIAAGCLPVVLCDGLQGAFPSTARYSSFWLKVPAAIPGGQDPSPSPITLTDHPHPHTPPSLSTLSPSHPRPRPRAHPHPLTLSPSPSPSPSPSSSPQPYPEGFDGGGAEDEL